ncbi:B2 protein [Hibiscus syriacus]|uniref:B2 protein n=1 Tax=Hibiscus syriacus TaxID=106335 RepID=A0A6A2ZBT1_HIBSY|nr:B2 protein [Hibiscus syriacus]
MESVNNFWQLGDDLRGQSKVAEDHKWLMAASKLAEQTRIKGERMNNLDISKGPAEMRMRDKFRFQEDKKFENLNFNMLNLNSKIGDHVSKSSFQNGGYNMNAVYQKNNSNILGNLTGNKYICNNHSSKDVNYNSNTNNNNNNSNETSNASNVVDKRFKTLPTTETLPRNEVLGGYIFVCNNDTMQEDLKRQLFGLPPRYRDSVRAITPGLPLFLYNYTTHQLHGESRFPAQVRIRIRKVCKALEEDAFRPVLHHYDGPKFRLELSVPETLDLLDLCEQAGSP